MRLQIFGDDYPSDERFSRRMFELGVVISTTVFLFSMLVAYESERNRRYASAEIRNIRERIARDQDEEKSLLTSSSLQEGAIDQLQKDAKSIESTIKTNHQALKNAGVGLVPHVVETQRKLDSTLGNLQKQIEKKANETDAATLHADVLALQARLTQADTVSVQQRSEIESLLTKNRDSIESIRRMGERDYFEFVIDKQKNPTQVSFLKLELTQIDPGNEQFDLSISVDGRSITKQKWWVSEPIYFYARGYKSPIEIVVTSIAGHKLTGYVSVPNSESSRGE